MIQNVHKDHRKRMREKFMQDGIESFQPHEVLEMLLFYSYRQRNTNEIAHRLLDRFGSLPAVFEADIKSLTEVPDVGENTAVFLKLLACVQRYYMKEKYSKEKGKKVTPDNVAEILEPLFCGYTEEVMYMISLDVSKKRSKPRRYLLFWRIITRTGILRRPNRTRLQRLS